MADGPRAHETAGLKEMAGLVPPPALARKAVAGVCAADSWTAWTIREREKKLRLISMQVQHTQQERPGATSVSEIILKMIACGR